MHARWIAVMAAVGLLAVPALAGAASSLSATDVRIRDHPAYVRVVVDLKGKLSNADVQLEASKAWLYSLRVQAPRYGKSTDGRTGDGVRVGVSFGTGFMHIGASFAPRRFKYVSYAVVGGNRLAIDLWKSAPRFDKPIHTCRGLRLSWWAANGRTVLVRGREHGIFENQFQVVVRDASGNVLGRNTVTGPGRWATRVRYHVTYSQPGTIEAVTFSEKDGSLECLAQQGINLPAT